MVSYLPWYGKKRERLAELEATFLAALQTATDAKRLHKSAETIRLAQIRALRAKRGQLARSEKNAVAVQNLNREIQFWLGLSVNQVIAGYRDGKLRGHRSSAVRRATR